MAGIAHVWRSRSALAASDPWTDVRAAPSRSEEARRILCSRLFVFMRVLRGQLARQMPTFPVDSTGSCTNSEAQRPLQQRPRHARDRSQHSLGNTYSFFDGDTLANPGPAPQDPFLSASTRKQPSRRSSGLPVCRARTTGQRAWRSIGAY